jgi:hypothetical protein
LGSGSIDPRFVDAGISSLVVSFRSRPLYPRGKLFLCLNNLLVRHKGVWGVDAYIQVFFTPVLFCELSASGLGLLTPGDCDSYAQLSN